MSANEKIVLGIIGVRGRGYALAMNLAIVPIARIAYLADVDTSLLGTPAPEGYAEHVSSVIRGPAAAGIEKAQGTAVKTVQDFRRILEDKSVDAVVIATPDKLACAATIWACQAGKDVYVEKPASHSPWEGRMIVEAARKYKRVVQLGTQSPSAPYIRAAKEYIRQGKIRKISISAAFIPCTLGATFPWLPTAIRLRDWTGTCGIVRPRNTGTRLRFATSGVTFGAVPAAILSTTGYTRWTSAAGCAAFSIRDRSMPAAAGSAAKVRQRRPIPKW